MKAKTLLSTLLAGAFICFSSVTHAQFHNSSSHSSSSESSSSGDGAFDEGNNIFDLGVGFAGGLSGGTSIVNSVAFTGSSYSGSASPGIRLTWERAKNEHWGYGLIFDYQSATFSDTYTQTVETGFDPNTGLPTFSTASYTDKFAVTLITIAARVTYHFAAGSNFDPYIGATIGYVTGSFTFSSSNPDGGDLSVSGTGIALGVQAGARYYFSSHIGAFGELAYCTNYGVNLLNVGLTFKI